MTKIDIKKIIDDALRTAPDINNIEANYSHKKDIKPVIHRDPMEYKIRVYDF